jgi:hypothetical protein
MDVVKTSRSIEMRRMERTDLNFMKTPRENAAERLQRIPLAPDATGPVDRCPKTFSETWTIQNGCGDEQVKIHAQFGWDLSMNLRLQRNHIQGAGYPVEMCDYSRRTSVP